MPFITESTVLQNLRSSFATDMTKKKIWVLSADKPSKYSFIFEGMAPSTIVGGEKDLKKNTKPNEKPFSYENHLMHKPNSTYATIVAFYFENVKTMLIHTFSGNSNLTPIKKKKANMDCIKEKCKLQSAAGNAPLIWTSVFKKRRWQTLWSSVTDITPPFV